MTRHMTISADWKDLGDEAETPDLHMNWEEGMEEEDGDVEELQETVDGCRNVKPRHTGSPL